VSARG
jgi:hypothetical protein